MMKKNKPARPYSLFAVTYETEINKRLTKEGLYLENLYMFL